VEALEDLAARQSKTVGTRVELRGTRMKYATRGAVLWFRPQNHRVDGYRVWASKPGQRFRGGMGATHGGITDVASRRSKSIKEALLSD
jgi:hypothetical protein